MRITTTAGRDADRFEARVHRPTGQYGWQQPTLQLSNYDRTLGAFLTIDEVRNLLDVLTAHADDLERVDREWHADREQAKAEAANDGFLDNADPDMDAAGADDYLADVQA